MRPITHVDYDIIIVGAGMIGSAAAKYAALSDTSLKVALVGPTEPKKKEDADIHGAYYDEGRICRSTDKDKIWATLAKRSFQRYQDIEKQTGIKVYGDVGYLLIAPKDSHYLNKYIETTKSNDEKFYLLQNPAEIHEKFPYIDSGIGVQGLHTPTNSGYVNPRNLVKAQKVIAQSAGCHYFDDIAESVNVSKDGTCFVKLEKSKRIMTGRKVLLCTGSFTHCRKLLPHGLVPDMRLNPNTVILVELDAEEREKLKNMPCIIYKGGKWDQPADMNFVAYIMPPILYPNGKYYFKLGHGQIPAPELKTPTDLTQWYHHGGDQQSRDHLYEIARTLFPDLKVDKYEYDYCVTTRTPKGYPYVDLVNPSLGVAIGGCGQAAKSSDEIGNIAASMIVNGAWTSDLPEGAFKFKSFFPHRKAKL